MEALIDSGRVRPSLPTIDTIGWVHLAAGNVDYAERLFAQALACDQVEPDDVAGVLAHLAAVRRCQDRAPEAAALLERARALRWPTRRRSWRSTSLRELATLDAERGDFRRAYRRLLRYVDEQRAGRARGERAPSLGAPDDLRHDGRA